MYDYDDLTAPALPDRKCLRCHEQFGTGERCQNCHIHRDRPVLSRSRMRRRNIGGKRGRNSGKVSSHGKK